MTSEERSAREGRTRLSRGLIVRAALEVVEREGVQALSMRAIARELDVEAMSLYNHVRGKSDILDGLVETVLEGIELPEELSGDWEEDFRAVSQAFRDAVLKHPQVTSLAFTRQLPGQPAALRVTDAALRVLFEAGFDEETAVHALRTVLAFQVGSILREVGAPTTSGPQTPDPALARGKQLTDSGLPALQRCAPLLASVDNGAEYAFGVEFLITALREMRKQPGPWRGHRLPPAPSPG